MRHKKKGGNRLKYYYYLTCRLSSKYCENCVLNFIRCAKNNKFIFYKENKRQTFPFLGHFKFMADWR